MNALILGTNDRSVILKNLIENVYIKYKDSPLKISAFVDIENEKRSIISGKPIVSQKSMIDWYHAGEVQKIIMPRDNLIGYTSILQILMVNGIKLEDFLISQQIDWNLFEDDRLDNLLEPYCDAKFLPYLEFHIADHCNLNCKACSHYSGLVTKPRFPNFNQWARDFDLLKTFIDDIGVIRILGGEPLLNPEILLYMLKARENYPLARIYIVTNGIRLMSMPEVFFEACRNLDIEIQVSLYLPMQSQASRLDKFLSTFGVKYGISDTVGFFEMKQILEPNDNPVRAFLQCDEGRCNNFYDGKIAACFFPFTTKYFNEYFGKNLPEDGAIDLHEPNLTTEILKTRLLTPFERCRYCTSAKLAPWAQIKNPSTLDDWIRE